MSKDPHFAREKEKYENPVASREYLLSILKENKAPLSFLEICQMVKANDEDSRIGIQRRLRAMEREGQIAFTREKKYEVQKQAELIRGTVIGHRDGFGFLKHSLTEKDYFIPVHQMATVIHGDVVEGTIDGQDRRGRTEFRVNRVIEPRQEAIVGRYYVEQGVGMVIPDDNRICHEIMISEGNDKGARQGNVVVVEITQRPRRHVSAIGKVSEVLGEHMAPGMEIETALRNFEIPHQWPKSVAKSLESLTEEVPEEAKEGRIDLRQLPLVTIDGEDARDFDDAVYCQPIEGGGWQLWVAIADVSSYVRVGTALDTEAQNRGTSVYFPEKVIPMLPEVLSNGLCSLNPEVDRLCMVCEMSIDKRGKLKEYQFYEAVMRSHARLTYQKVWHILQGDETLIERYKPRVDDLHHLNDLFGALKLARTGRGAIEFETQETKFVFNAQRKIENIVPLIRNDAHKIIEECMIMANVCAAQFIEKHTAEALFRVHDKPDEDRLLTFKNYLREIGIEFTSGDQPSPHEFTKVIHKTAHRLDKELIQTMLLRSMKQAVYDGNNIGHFGLALEAYAHFTSPIRRYPDLIVHRVIKAIINKVNGNKGCKGAKFYTEDEISQLGEQCSVAERRADDATRDVSDWLKCEFMQDHVGDVFDGVVASVTNFGLFVRLNDYHIDGLVHITSLASDFYRYDEVKQCLVGESYGLTYRLGDPLKVKVAAVNLDERKIDLILDGMPAITRKLKSGKGKTRGDKEKGANKPNTQKPPRASKSKGKRKAGTDNKRNKSSRNKPKR
ncbi:ribonuclease R [Glaciecola sp. XM2]|jgi:ribonuclease R|uniref:ribonuclease R n=1 Tax=Glaciecola sp. XM2 TaxID=1914931 RepID=UPI001BDEAE78|nr:ribonuclease R [Glaciecola sp. XM2]MBT1452251.1 ribonuclease R [Glaciecola sp. XM2]